MPEGRDRLSRHDDESMEAYSRRRIAIGNPWTGRGSLITFVLEDDNEAGLVTPFRWRGRAMVGTPGSMGAAARGGGARTPRIRRFAPITGPENRGHRHGHGGGSTLPTWYPRRPLNDITAVMRAIERRGEHQRDREGLETGSPILHDRISQPLVSTSSAQHEHKMSFNTPLSMLPNRCCPSTIGKVPKILLDITHKNGEDSTCLTPQKKLLINIDTVEKVVMEELRNLKRTPSAKKAEREKRVRTLMSMR